MSVCLSVYMLVCVCVYMRACGWVWMGVGALANIMKNLPSSIISEMIGRME